ncbi:hypothetical protein K438DRAFT_73625 [Mycena galopus ATCC 62051]|nr:hypothetical protein K438DRAFT_73625 [Mycena galopus ATCC 62051]
MRESWHLLFSPVWWSFFGASRFSHSYHHLDGLLGSSSVPQRRSPQALNVPDSWLYVFGHAALLRMSAYDYAGVCLSGISSSAIPALESGCTRKINMQYLIRIHTYSNDILLAHWLNHPRLLNTSISCRRRDGQCHSHHIPLRRHQV